jgi:hypothetical protein
MAWRVAVAMLAGLLAWPAQPVLAQGSLQQMFGNGPPPPRLYGYPGLSPNRSLYVWPSPRPFGSQPPERRDDPAFGRAGIYRTMCVRLCDGFYFPISSATTGSGLARDADACNASCGTEARLFYHPNVGGDVDSMTDLTGMAYSALPNAFRYRKALVADCRCRPQPWSEVELQRHRSYAGDQSVPVGTGSQTPQAARESSTQPNDTPMPIERPEPVARESGLEEWPPVDTRYGRPAGSRYSWPETGSDPSRKRWR